MHKHLTLWNEVEPSEIAGILQPAGYIETMSVDSLVHYAKRIKRLLAVSPKRRNLEWTKSLKHAIDMFQSQIKCFYKMRKLLEMAKKPLICLADIIAEDEKADRKRRPRIDIACSGHDGLVELHYRASKVERKQLYRNMTAKPAKRRRKGPKPTDIAPLN